MALAFRQCLNITQSNFDFDHNPPLTKADLSNEYDYSKVYSRAAKMHQADLLEKLMDLCLIMTKVLSMTTTVQGPRSPNMSESVAALDRCSDFDLELKTWYRSFSTIKLPNDEQLAPTEALTTSIIFFTNLVKLHYL